MTQSGDNRFYLFLQPPPVPEEINSYDILLTEVSHIQILRCKKQNVQNNRAGRKRMSSIWIAMEVGLLVALNISNNDNIESMSID